MADGTDRGYQGKGKRTLGSHIGGPWRVASRCGEIWREAPTSVSAEQGRMIHFNPRLFDVTRSIDGGTGNYHPCHFGGYDATAGGSQNGELHMCGGGRLWIQTGATTANYISWLINYHDDTTQRISPAVFPYKPRAGTITRMGVKFKLGDVDKIEFGIGLYDTLCGTPYDFLDDDDIDKIILRVEDGETQPTIAFSDTTTGAETEMGLLGSAGTAAAALDATWHEAGFVLHGVTRLVGYFDGYTCDTTTLTNLPQTVCMTPAIEVRTLEDGAHLVGIERWTITQEMTDYSSDDYDPDRIEQ